MDYSRFLTHRARQRKPGALRALGKRALTECPVDIVFMAGGLPTPEGNPFTEASFTMNDGSILNLTPDLMKQSLQYFVNQMYDPLMETMKRLVLQSHSPPLWGDTQMVPTVGGLDGIARAFDVTVEQGDYILVQEPCYQTVITMLKAYEVKCLSVESDEDGPIPDSLRKVLSQWTPEEMSQATTGVPKVMYLNPSASNPSGVSAGNSRRKEIYEIACKYNLLILEDDAYYYIQFGPRDMWPKSYLSMDTEGRVLRFDSCSKIIAAGLRIGFATGPSPIVESIRIHMELSAQQPSSLSQILIGELLNKWGDEGFWKHVSFINDIYKKRRDVTIHTANKYLSELCEWNVPSGGMFLWIKIKGLKDTWALAERCLRKGVTFGPGAEFAGRSDRPSNYIRVAYSVIPLDTLDKGFQRLAEGIREELEIQNK